MCAMKSVAILFLISLAAVSAEDLNDALQKRMERLEQRYDMEIASMKADYGNRITELKQNVVQLKGANEEYGTKIRQLEERILYLENVANKAIFDSLEKTIDDYKHGHESETGMENIAGVVQTNTWNATQKVADIKANRKDQAPENHKRHSRRTRALSDGDGLNIAFTAYLDHTIDNQGPNQPLVFNQMLLNHGGGYNNNTGVFTAPVAGVYSFTFFIGQRDNNQFYAQLIVNNKHVLDAVVETSHATQDLQGGNAANLQLAKGDSVFLRHYNSIYTGSHLEGSNGVRITTFSGFLIYPLEASMIVGK